MLSHKIAKKINPYFYYGWFIVFISAISMFFLHLDKVFLFQHLSIIILKILGIHAHIFLLFIPLQLYYPVRFYLL